MKHCPKIQVRVQHFHWFFKKVAVEIFFFFLVMNTCHSYNFFLPVKTNVWFRHTHDILSFLAPGYWHLHDPCRGHSQNSQRRICVVPLQPRPLVTNCVYLFIVCCYTKSEKREFPNPITTNNKALLLTNLMGSRPIMSVTNTDPTLLNNVWGTKAIKATNIGRLIYCTWVNVCLSTVNFVPLFLHVYK